MKAAEEALFATGVEAEPLMEKAGLGCARAIHQFFPKPGKATLFIGKGHNGGDAAVIGRHLRTAGWSVESRLGGAETDLAPLTRKKLAELDATSQPLVRELENPVQLQVDGLLGIGASGALRGSLNGLAAEMNENRLSGKAVTVAID
ncbi:MAG: NAD(P)H-hydrate epimerase, partial [Verrucomicrobiota bacterium]